MKIHRLLINAALLAAISVSLAAQQEPSGFHRVACLKVKLQDTAAFLSFATGDVDKLAQYWVKSGKSNGWLLLRSVVPMGQSAKCDYLAVTVYPGVPTEFFNSDQVAEALKQTGSKMSAQMFLARRDSVATLVSNDLFQTRAMVGGIKKGDYLEVLYQKVPNPQAWLANDKKVWQPVAEAMLKDGTRSGWYAVFRVLPSGSSMDYNAINVDVFPSLEAVFKPDAQFVDRWKKVHPDMDLASTMQGLDKFRTTVNEELYTVVDAVNPTK
jgi:hypothetical protein